MVQVHLGPPCVHRRSAAHSPEFGRPAATPPDTSLGTAWARDGEAAVTTADWKKVVRPHLGPDWTIRRRFAYLQPIGWNAFGLLAEGSSRSTPGFHVYRVRLPLLPHTSVMNLSWSNRLGGGSRLWEPADPGLPTVLMNAIRESERDHAQTTVTLSTSAAAAANVNMMETRAYALLVDGRVVEARALSWTRGTTSRRPNCRVGSSPSAAARYADPRLMPSTAAASLTVSVTLLSSMISASPSGQRSDGGHRRHRAPVGRRVRHLRRVLDATPGRLRTRSRPRSAGRLTWAQRGHERGDIGRHGYVAHSVIR